MRLTLVDVLVGISIIAIAINGWLLKELLSGC